MKIVGLCCDKAKVSTRLKKSLLYRRQWPTQFPEVPTTDWKMLCTDLVMCMHGMHFLHSLFAGPATNVWRSFLDKSSGLTSVLQIPPAFPFEYCNCTWISWKALCYYWFQQGLAQTAALTADPKPEIWSIGQYSLAEIINQQTKHFSSYSDILQMANWILVLTPRSS